jgi:hypothetical protein
MFKSNFIITFSKNYDKIVQRRRLKFKDKFQTKSLSVTFMDTF